MQLLEPEVEVRPKCAGTHRLPQVTAGGRDHPHVDATRPRLANPHDLPLPEDPQQHRLGRHRQLADLVEKQHAALRILEHATMVGRRTRERPATMPEQFTRKQLPIVILRTVHRQEGQPVPGAQQIQGTRKQLLARPRFTGDQHRTGRTRKAVHPIKRAGEDVVRADQPHGVQRTPPRNRQLLDASGRAQ